MIAQSLRAVPKRSFIPLYSQGIDKDYKDIVSSKGVTSISLKSNADITKCKYNVTVEIEKNTFQNKSFWIRSYI